MKRALLSTALALFLAAPAMADTVVISGGTVALGDGSAPIPNGQVVITDGRVVAAGDIRMKLPAGTRVIDATGKWVTPGIVAGFSRLGLVDVDAVDQTNDTSSDGPFSAALDVATAINPNAAPVAINRAEGITRAVVAPSAGKSIFAGQGALIDTAADADPVTRARLFQYVELGEQGAGQAGGSRTAAHVLLRNALREAQQVAGGGGSSRADSGRSAGGAGSDPVIANPNESRSYEARRNQDVLLTRFDALALVPVVRGRQILAVHVERAADLRQVIALKREFPALRLVIVGADEGWTVASELAAANIPVIASALSDLPAQFENLAATQSNIGRMRAAGVRVAIGTVNDDESRMAFRARYYAGNLVGLTRVPRASGLSWGEALKAITSAPAEVLGLTDIGSLTPGKRGDVVIWNGDPLDNMSAAEMVMIDGVEQPLVTRQTRLRDRYRDLERGALPEAYRH
ncbi:amidohydrolase [Sphingomonas astaxanthinifaciens DSM 22298]|uniref:Amidohydrolase n=2 Tax=Sphingomonas TaxID=13687 RepID=A0ABQ5Z5Y9_9SPHN|nr:amidohydrolase [Sphingomonas astaxanthinifaciens DSM 22298]